MTSRAYRCEGCGCEVDHGPTSYGGAVWCVECETAATIDAAAARSAVYEDRDRARLVHHGIPARSAGLRLSRHRKQPTGTTFEAFRAGLEPGVVGITAWNVAAARVLRDWHGDSGVMLVGPVGAGKSALLASRVSELILDGLRVVWIDEHSAFELLRDWDRRWDAIRAMVSADLLVIDDLGAVRAGGVWREDYEGIVSRRYAAERPTAATSNLDLDQLAGVLGERVVSRLAEDLGGGRMVVAVSGYDWRTGHRH